MTSSRRKIVITAQIAVVIFAVEALIMELMPEELPSALETFLDASSLTLLSSPIIYYWVIAPYVRIRDQAEAMLANLQLQREQTLAQAEEAARMKTQFMANMSHELRTPMTAILGMIDLALANETTPRQRGYLEKVQRASHHLLALVNNVLDFSKVDAGQVVLERVPFELDDVLDQLGLLAAGRAEERRIPLVWAVAPEVPRRLVGDPTRLGQVLLNLVGNALKFSERGSVTVELRWEDARLRGVVRDEGIGMTPEQCGRLFRPFTQADASTNRKFGGTGLGLVISKSLVELMGGKIHVESELGRGTSFHFDVCVEAAPSDPAREPAALAATLTHLAGAPTAVVLTHAPSREVLVSQLSALGLDPVVCATVEEAVALATRTPLAAAFLDSWLPGLVPATLGARLGAPVCLLGLHGAALPPEVTSVLRPTTISQLHAALAPRPAAVAPVVKTRSLAGARVLVVDDVELNRELLAELLAGEGVDVRLACDGVEAIERVIADPPDAVLMDNQMPLLDGAEATRRLRADARFHALPIISITANADAETRSRMAEAGANETLAKPIDQAALFATLARWIAPRAAPELAVVEAPVEAPAPVEVVATPVPDVAPPQTLPGVDVAAGLAAVGGKPQLYRKLLASFGGQLDDLDGELLLAVVAADWSAAARAAHAIKGAARTLGANEIGDRAAAVEAAARDAAGDPLDAIEALRAAAHQLRPALAA